MKTRRVLAALVGGLIIAVGAEAHHSFTATYDESKEVRIEGTLVAFHFRNPHASVDILAEDENGRAAAWVQAFGGASGTGFVHVATARVPWDAYPAIRAAAEYGILPRPGVR